MRKQRINSWVTLVFLFLPLILFSQVQEGYVKTAGKPGCPGEYVPNVVLRVKGQANAVVSSSEGRFLILSPDKKDGDEFVFVSISKPGYELIDPEILGRPHVFSQKVPLEIVLISVEKLEAERRRIEENAYKVAEDQYKQRSELLHSQLAEAAISEEDYRKRLRLLQERYDSYIVLAGKMAERYARTDYDNLDSIECEIYQCIERGHFDRADSLIHTIFDPSTVLERNQKAKLEVEEKLRYAQKVIEQVMADKDALLKDKVYARKVISLCETLANEYEAQSEWEMAEEYRNRAKMFLEYISAK